METRERISGVARLFADPTLINVSDVAKRAGFEDPFAMTEETYLECVTQPADFTGESERLRTFKVLCAMYSAVKSGKNRREHADRSVFRFWMNIPSGNGEDTRQVHLKAYCGPGDFVVLAMTTADEE